MKLKKTMEHAGDNYTNCDWRFWYSNKGLLKGLEDLEVGGRVETIHTIIDNGQNTEKSPGDLRRLAVSQTPVKNYQLKLMLKTLMSK